MPNQSPNHKTHKKKSRGANAPVTDPKDISVRGAVVVVEEVVDQKTQAPAPHKNSDLPPRAGNIEDDDMNATLSAEDWTPGDDATPPDDSSDKNKNDDQS